MNLFSAGADDMHGKGHVFVDALFVDQAKILEDHAEPAAQKRQLPPLDGAHVEAVHLDLAGIGPDLPAQKLDDRGFPAAAGPHEEHKFSLADIQRQPVGGPCAAAAVGHGNVF